MILDKLSLAGKVALVVGASQGLGRGMALALAEAGADLALAARSEEGLAETARQARALGRRTTVIPTDVRELPQIRAMVERVIAEYGQIDILCNAAGINRRKPILEATEADWDDVLDTNLKAVFFTSQAVARHMIPRRRGKIINVASLTSVIGIENVAAYGASKGGVAQLTKAMAVEWAKYRLNVNAVGPGYFRTHLTEAVFADPERRAWIEGRIPFHSAGTPDDLAGAVVFLASAAADYITGQILFVDGGWTAS